MGRTYFFMQHILIVNGAEGRHTIMPLPPGITKKLLQATADKTELNKRALRINRSFQEVSKFLGTASKSSKEKKED